MGTPHSWAARAVQLAREVTGEDLEPSFVRQLAKARSNLPRFGDGAGVWEACVRPSAVSLERAAAHHVIASLFDGYPNRKRVYAYRGSVPSARRATTRVNRSGSRCSCGARPRSPLASVIAPPTTKFSRCMCFTNSTKRA